MVTTRPHLRELQLVDIIANTNWDEGIGLPKCLKPRFASLPLRFEHSLVSFWDQLAVSTYYSMHSVVRSTTSQSFTIRDSLLPLQKPFAI